MKRRKILFGVLAVSILAALFFYREKFQPVYEAWLRHRVEYLQVHHPQDLAAAIRKADQTHLYRLGDFGPNGPAGQQFPIRPYETEALILEHKILSPDAHQKLRDAFATALTMPEGGSALCHDPAYGLRFFQGNRLVFETSLCWKCSNYYIEFPMPFGPSWMGMSDGFEDVRKLVMAEMPLPEGTVSAN